MTSKLEQVGADPVPPPAIAAYVGLVPVPVPVHPVIVPVPVPVPGDVPIGVDVGGRVGVGADVGVAPVAEVIVTVAGVGVDKFNTFSLVASPDAIDKTCVSAVSKLTFATVLS